MSRAAALFREGKLDEARDLAQDLVRADNRHFYALHLLSVIAQQSGELEEAIGLAGRALEIEPHNVEVLCNRGAVLRKLHRFEEALEDYDRALTISPESHVALNNRGVALAALNRHREAIQNFDEALRLRPGYAQAHYSRAVSRLTLGELAAGWDDYEWRWSGSDQPSSMRQFDVPMFTDDDWGRCRVALWTEQGIGDQLLFSTLVPELEARRQDFALEVDERLVPAFRRAHPTWTVVPNERSMAGFAGCDRHLPIGSLPRLLRRTRESFHRQPKALLAADPVRANQFRSGIGISGRVVGIAWRSFQPKLRAYYEGRKTAPLAVFRDLSRSHGIRLLDLQYGDNAPERAAFARSGGELSRIEDLDVFSDLDGLLAAIAACDVVVSTSNVTAHLAGCLGKRTFLMVLGGKPAFHYWVPDARGYSPWYPSVEIVTGPAMDSWEKTMQGVTERLGIASPGRTEP